MYDFGGNAWVMHIQVFRLQPELTIFRHRTSTWTWHGAYIRLTLDWPSLKCMVMVINVGWNYCFRDQQIQICIPGRTRSIFGDDSHFHSSSGAGVDTTWDGLFRACIRHVIILYNNVDLIWLFEDDITVFVSGSDHVQSYMQKTNTFSLWLHINLAIILAWTLWQGLPGRPILLLT